MTPCWPLGSLPPGIQLGRQTLNALTSKCHQPLGPVRCRSNGAALRVRPRGNAIVTSRGCKHHANANGAVVAAQGMRHDVKRHDHARTMVAQAHRLSVILHRMRVDGSGWQRIPPAPRQRCGRCLTPRRSRKGNSQSRPSCKNCKYTQLSMEGGGLRTHCYECRHNAN